MEKGSCPSEVSSGISQSVNKSILQEEITTATEGSGAGGGAKANVLMPAELEGLTIREEEAVEEEKPTSSERLEMATSPPTKEQLREHPLQNPVILGHLFELCSAQLLANCRLVCKQWWESSLSSFRSFSCLEVDMNRFFPDRKELHSPISTSALGTLLEFMNNPLNNCEVKPFKCMKLSWWLLDRELSAITSAVMRLWERHGRNLTTLILKECLFVEIDDFRHIIFVHCSNLKSLELERCRFFEYSAPHYVEYREPAYGEQANLKSLIIEPGFSEGHPVPWAELLTHFQELTTLRFKGLLTYADEYLDKEIDRFFDTLHTIRKGNQRKLQLTTLELSTPLRVSRDPTSQAKFALLRELRLPLEQLGMEPHPEMSREDDKLMRGILEYFWNTIVEIEVIEMSPHYTTPPHPWTFPCQVELPELKSLTVTHVDFGNMEFIKYTPNLANLYVSESDNVYYPEVATDAVNTMVPNSRKPELELDNIKLLHLTNLSFGYVLSDMDIKSLIRWMPNVKDLRMPLNDKQFSIVCNNWKALVILSVHGEDLTDEGITGIGEHSCEETGHLEIPDPPQANITSLQGLEEFSSVYCGNITDLSVFHGFLKLPKLRRISILATTQWGEEAKRCLEGKGISVCDEWY